VRSAGHSFRSRSTRHRPRPPVPRLLEGQHEAAAASDRTSVGQPFANLLGRHRPAAFEERQPRSLRRCGVSRRSRR
jgi:hypothetical protein